MRYKMDIVNSKRGCGKIKKTEKREKSIVEEYIELLHNYQEKYGNKIALLYQVGSFMEIYAIRNPTSPEFIENPEIENIAAICSLAIADKKQTCPIIHEESGMVLAAPVYMAGVRDYILEKYLTFLSEAGYTSIVYTQEPRGGSFIRKLECIVSCGTHITYEDCGGSGSGATTAAASNYIMCIWCEKINVIQKMQPQILIGLSTTNIFTGKTYFFEYTVPFHINPTNFDELERQISTFCPNEIIFISNLSAEQIQTVLKYSNVKCSLIHYIDIDKNEKAQNCTKQRYIQHTFKTYLRGGDNVLQTCIEFQTNLIATQSFCYLLDFIHEHNPNLIKNITLPVIQNTSIRMILGNQTLKQLNLIDDGSGSAAAGGAKSVLQFLNRTCSPMGRRLFHQQFVNPVFDKEWLQKQYDMIGAVLDAPIDLDMPRQILGGIKDIEKLARQIIIRKIFPSAIYGLYISLREVATLYDFIKTPGNFPDAADQLLDWAAASGEDGDVGKPILDMLAFLDKYLFIEFCKTTSSMTTFDNNIFRPGVFSELDEIAEKYEKFQSEFREIYDFLNSLIEKEEKDAVKIHETEKNGLSFQITKRRGIILKKLLERDPAHADIKIVSASGANDEITSPKIRECCKKIAEYKEKLNVKISTLYYNFLSMIERDYYSTIEFAATFVANIDVLMCKAYIARKYNYCQPVIGDERDDSSYVRAKSLRHVLIEHINTNEIYVPNDVDIGNSGVLIYGVNTTGKTSYIRSVGIAIVMAQSGMYVPAQSFEYSPYRSIFSRILGNDNLFHGLSTFAVEMSELRVILKMSDKNTLVIGDEVCSGTENQSALSIFVAALMDLYDKKCSFLFATHFHEIVDYEEIREMVSGGRVKIKHMSVMYDRERDCLIYERKLCEGAGYRMYGIEICKSLHMPADFIERAYQLRTKYYAETTGALSHKQSTYNSDKIRGLCEKCGVQIARETHHISPQCIADADGIIRDESDTVAPFHKNHLQNLMALCEKCHDMEHVAIPATPKRRGRPSTKKM